MSMRILYTIIFTLFSVNALACKGTLLDHNFRKLASTEEVNLCEAYSGKVLLVVNTASRCGFTPQYKSLEKVFKKYKEKDFVVLAFPSNDFRQELSSNEEIKEFCEAYQLSFPIFAEGKVKGFGKQDVFKYLTEDSNGKSKGEIRWNFEKFLVNRDGKLFKRFRSSLDPNQEQITQAIESLL